MGGVRPRRAGHACATSPFRVADDSCRGRRCGRRGGTCRRRVLSDLSGRARTFRRPVGREYRRGNRGYHSRQPLARSGWPERRQSHDREPFGALLQQRRLNHSKQLYMIGTDSSNSLALPTSRAVAAFSRAVCEMPAATSTVRRAAGKSCCCPEGSRNYGVEGAAGTGAASPSAPPGAGASLGAAAAFRRCTARRRCVILRCGTSVLAATLFGAVSDGLRAGCGLLSTGRSGLGCGGSLHWAELAVASQNLVRANRRRKERTCDRWPAPASNGQGKSSSVDRNHSL